jgi:uncharacterized protein (DUF2384 family)
MEIKNGTDLPITSYSAIYCKIAVEAYMSASPHREIKKPIENRQAKALKGFFSIMQLWDVDNETARRIIGSPPERTFYQWKKGNGLRLPEDTMRRIGYVAGIWKALQIVYSRPDHADSWVKRPNKFFGGHTPLQRMAAGDVTDLAAVRAYIDAARGLWA